MKRSLIFLGCCIAMLVLDIPYGPRSIGLDASYKILVLGGLFTIMTILESKK